MKLYLLTQTDTTGYDTFDACVVAAESEEDAKSIHPRQWPDDDDNNLTWAYSPSLVTAKLIGDAYDYIKRGVILASFNAG